MVVSLQGGRAWQKKAAQCTAARKQSAEEEPERGAGSGAATVPVVTSRGVLYYPGYLSGHQRASDG